MEFGDFAGLIGLAAALAVFWAIKPLRTLAAVPGWVLILVPSLTRWLLVLFKQDFIILAKGNSLLVAPFNWLTTSAGHFVVLLIGAVWLLAVFTTTANKDAKIQRPPRAAQTKPSKEIKSNLTLQPLETRRTQIDGGEVTCLCVPFRNDVNTFADAARSTMAHLTYRGSNIDGQLIVHSASWVDADFNSVTIDRAETARLILAVVSNSGDECFAVNDERDRADRQGNPEHLHPWPLGCGTWSVSVELSAEGYRNVFPQINFGFTKQQGLYWSPPGLSSDIKDNDKKLTAPSSRLVIGGPSNVAMAPAIPWTAHIFSVHNKEDRFENTCHNVRADITFTFLHTGEQVKAKGMFVVSGSEPYVGNAVPSASLEMRESRHFIVLAGSYEKEGFRTISAFPFDPNNENRLKLGEWHVRIEITSDSETDRAGAEMTLSLLPHGAANWGALKPLLS